MAYQCSPSLTHHSLPPSLPPIDTGDEVDALYHDEMVDIVQMTGSPERAYGVFVDVVKNLFEWDETTHRGQSPANYELDWWREGKWKFCINVICRVAHTHVSINCGGSEGRDRGKIREM